MHTAKHFYTHDNLTCEGFLATPDDTLVRPAVLVAHDWSGRNAFACAQAEALAKLGYVGFALDMYGNGTQGETTAEKTALMEPLINDRAKLQARLLAALHTVAALPQVDPHRIAIIGFCFGGLCALDLARCGANITAAVSFHGLLHPPPQTVRSTIKAAILVLHGHDDPMVKPSQVNAFCDEMTQAEADWQVHCYSQTQHAFMVPTANDPTLGTRYQPRTAARAERLMVDFLQEQLSEVTAK